MDVENWDYQTIETSLHRPLSESIGRIEHPYGDGHTGQRVAHLLATLPLESLPIRKRNTY